MPTSSTATKTLGCWCCKSGPITAKAWLSQTGHVPGQTLYLNAEIENLSRKKMRGSKVQLVEVSCHINSMPLRVHFYNFFLITKVN